MKLHTLPRLSRWLVGAAVALTMGCNKPARPDASAANEAGSKETVETSVPRATPWQAAVKGLEDQLANAERKFAVNPTQDNRGAWVGYLLESSTRLGRVSALDKALELANRGVELAPEHPKPRLLRAQVLGAVHRFHEALSDLDKAEAAGVDPSTTAPRRATLWMALGRLDEACPVLTREREKFANHVNLTLEAMCLGKRGAVEEADRRFAQANAAYRNVSPFILGWMAFERGSMWDRAGQPDRALTYYREAVAYMPVYAHAAGHLAYAVEPTEAHTILERVIASADDPEYVAAMAHTMNRQLEGSGDETAARAKRGYEALMAKQPLAFADHAGWFYLAVAHDPERALEAAELNLANRQVAEAYELHIAALSAVGDIHAACESAEAGLALRYGSRGLKVRAARAFERCGLADRAHELALELARGDARLAAR